MMNPAGNGPPTPPQPKEVQAALCYALIPREVTEYAIKGVMIEGKMGKVIVPTKILVPWRAVGPQDVVQLFLDLCRLGIVMQLVPGKDESTEVEQPFPHMRLRIKPMTPEGQSW